MARRPRSDMRDRAGAIHADFALLSLTDARFVVRSLKIALVLKEREHVGAIQASILDEMVRTDIARLNLSPESKPAPESSHDGIVEDSNIKAGAIQAD